MPRIFRTGSPSTVILTAVVALAAASCGGQPEQAAPANPTPPQGASPTAAAPDARGRGQGSGLQWPRAASIDVSAQSALPAAVRDRLQESPLPVLIPSDRGLLAAAGPPTIDSDKYTFTSRTPDLTVSILASVSAPSTDPQPRAQSLPRVQAGSRNIFLTQNEGIRVATWEENGVAYSAEVECAKATDVRCRDDRYLVSMIEKLAFVGGKGAQVP